MSLIINQKGISAHILSGMSRIWFYRIFLCAFFLTVIYNTLPAQKQDTTRPLIFIELENDNESGGRIEIVQPVQVENLLKMQVANNKLQTGIPGYRIQIFSLSGNTARQKAIDARTTFMKNYPEIEAYLEHNDPNFQVLIGDFRTKTEALHEKKRIEKMFPRAFIVSEIINIPK